MLAVSQWMLVTALLSSGADVLGDAPGWELRYSGTLSRVTRSTVEQPLKKFTLLAVASRQADGLKLTYLTDERGNGSWAWPERFGTIELNSKLKANQDAAIRLLAEHEGHLYPIPLRQPFFEHADKLAVLDTDDGEDTWEAGAFSYEVVEGAKKIKDRDCHLIRVSTNNGRKQRLWVAKHDHTLLVAAEQQVFMGRGDEFQLKFELESAKPLTPPALSKLQKPFQILSDLKARMNRPDGETKPELTEAQTAAASKVVDQLQADAEETPLAPLAAIISRDVKSQTQRADDVANVSKKFVGQPAPTFELTTLDKKTISSKELAGKIVVLHFWDYDSDPLVEPYGQVGYLDFLSNKRKRFGIEVIGVATNESFADPAKTTGALRSVRKLREFMNLGYPIATDDGTLVAKFGDPRKLGAKLPLWIVIDPDGKIAHYHVGFYAIKPDEGLRPLDEAVMKQIKTK
ncbi:MAG: peroxiredoxin family protein [Planctomycetaceae bacterium]